MSGKNKERKESEQLMPRCAVGEVEFMLLGMPEITA
jgi:hypothetical protein